MLEFHYPSGEQLIKVVRTSVSKFFHLFKIFCKFTDLFNVKSFAKKARVKNIIKRTVPANKLKKIFPNYIQIFVSFLGMIKEFL